MPRNREHRQAPRELRARLHVIPRLYKPASSLGNNQMKYATSRAFANPEAAARQSAANLNAAEAVRDGRIHIEKLNGPFLFKEGGSPDEYKAGLDLAIARGWRWLHESGTYVKFTPAGAEPFA